MASKPINFEEYRRRVLNFGGGSGTSDGMPPDVDKRLAVVEGDVKSLTKDVAEIKGRLSQMPTTFQMISAFLGVSIGLIGLVFTIARVMR